MNPGGPHSGPGDRAGTVARTCGLAAPRALGAAGLYVHLVAQAQDVVMGLTVTARKGSQVQGPVASMAQVLPLRMRVTAGMSVRDLAREASARSRGARVRWGRYCPPS
ncbi:hypothetical protein ACFZAU_25005 [Streptomyces sp. NPDC008238]